MMYPAHAVLEPESATSVSFLGSNTLFRKMMCHLLGWLLAMFPFPNTELWCLSIRSLSGTIPRSPSGKTIEAPQIAGLKVPIGDEPESLYMVVDGQHYNDQCCFDFGNAETDERDDGTGTMEAVYWGNSSGGAMNHGGAGQGLFYKLPVRCPVPDMCVCV